MEESIITDNMGICFVCGRLATEVHHVYFGRNRKTSTKYKLLVGLCPYCHRLSNKAVHAKDGHALDLALKKIGQKKFEERYSHELFMQEIGINYL